MATPGRLLAASLDVMKKVIRQGIIKSSEIERTHRERLLKTGFLNEITKGWLFATDPCILEGRSTPWYAAYWAFVSQYLEKRFKDEYCLAAEASLKIHTGSTVVPRQLIVFTKRKITQQLDLPFDTSLLIYHEEKRFPADRLKLKDLWIMGLPAALCRLQPSTFKNDPADAEMAMRMIGDAAVLLRILLENGNTAIAGRIAGGYRFLGESDFADRIINGMEAAGYKIRIENPFEQTAPALLSGIRIINPYISRIEAMWRTMRPEVMKIFPKAPGMPDTPDRYLKNIENIYVNDAYNSLSIEGYEVTPDLIEQIRKGRWNPDESGRDRQQKDAMAAKGYNLAFKAVLDSIKKILNGKNPGVVLSTDHHKWYTQMFSPSVQAGILKPSDLAGYRSSQVYIKGSKHVPPPKEAVFDCMETLLNLQKEEQESGVRAVLGHFIFVFIHPYIDGNGRMGRFLMNAMFASGGYPWTVIRMERRGEYMIALEEASISGNIKKLAEIIKREGKH